MNSLSEKKFAYFDPVCGLEIDPQKLNYRTSVRGHTYYFCTEKCRNVFNRDPIEFIDIHNLLKGNRKWWRRYLDTTQKEKVDK